jgi:hypothetical protein
VIAEVGARFAAQNQTGRFDHGALFIDPRRQHDAVTGQGRSQRALQAVIAAVRLRGAERAGPQRARVAGLLRSIRRQGWWASRGR